MISAGDLTNQVKGVSSNVPVLSTKGEGATWRGDQRVDHRSVRSKDGGEGRGGGDSNWRTTEGKRKRRQEREMRAVVLDEIAPKETGRQATLVSAN